jgi:hypothetical protein
LASSIPGPCIGFAGSIPARLTSLRFPFSRRLSAGVVAERRVRRARSCRRTRLRLASQPSPLFASESSSNIIFGSERTDRQGRASPVGSFHTGFQLQTLQLLRHHARGRHSRNGAFCVSRIDENAVFLDVPVVEARLLSLPACPSRSDLSTF